MEELKKVLSNITGITTTLFKHITVSIIFDIITKIFIIFSANYSFSNEELSFWLVFILVVTYFSTSFAFSLFNKQQCFKFLSKDTKDILPEFFTFDFLFDIVGTLFFFLFFSLRFVSVFAIVAAMISNIVNFALARFMWLKDKENKISTRYYEIRLVAHLLLSVIGISLFFFFATNLIPAVSTLIMIAKMLSYLIFIPIGLTIVLYLMAIHKMRKFLSDFKKFCKKQNISFPDIKKPYTSVFHSTPDTTFLLFANNKTYSCSLVSFTNIFLPLVFKTDGFMYRISKRNLKDKTKPILSFEKRFTHESEYQKIVIITSSPSTIMVQQGNKLKEFDTGDMCADCKIFTPQGFFGSIERNTIERNSFE